MFYLFNARNKPGSGRALVSDCAAAPWVCMSAISPAHAEQESTKPTKTSVFVNF